MYSSLDKVDIGIEGADGKVAVQTDHRSRTEIEADWELSVLFALTRALNPVRTSQFATTRFSFMSEPPERFAALLHAAGAETEVMEDGEPVPADPDPREVDTVAAAALRALGARLFAERGLPVTEQGLLILQAEYARRAAEAVGPRDDEIAWWTAVIELGAAVGEAILQEFGQTAWTRDPEFYSTVPFMVGRGGSLTNVFGKVERFFEEGESEQPLVLLRMLRDDSASEGQVMFNLRPRTWAGREHALAEPLLAMDSLEGSDVPLVAVVVDMPSTTRTYPRDTADDEQERLRAEARKNLAALEVQVEEIDAADMPILVTHGNFYAGEKLLDVDHMNQLHAQLQSDMLLASVPVKGTMFCATALTTPDRVGMFGMVVQGQHERAPRNERISSEVFLVREGRVVGLARAKGAGEAPVDSDEPPKKGFWARLFGG